MLEIRHVGPDVAGPLAVFFEALTSAGDSHFFHPHSLDAKTAKSIANYIGSDLYYVVTDGGCILGYGILRGWDSGYTTPSLGIAIHPAMRGRGLGKLLMLFLHAAAYQHGARRVRLKVYPENGLAIRLYKQLGYVFEEANGDQLVGICDL